MAEYDTKRDAAGNPVVVERRSNNMGWLVALLVVVALVVAAFALGLIKMDADPGKIPDVNVTTSGGEAPSVKADVADIDIGSKKETVAVPTVGTKDTEIDVPTISVDKAKEPDAK